MKNNFWNDERGGVITTELVLVASTTVAIVLSGMNAIRSGIQAEFENVSQTIQSNRIQNAATFDVARRETVSESNLASPTAYVEIFQNEDWN